MEALLQSVFAEIRETSRRNLAEQRLQTLHLEHIARQGENITMVLTLFARMSAPDDAREEITNLLNDFKQEAQQWREQTDYVKVDGNRDV